MFNYFTRVADATGMEFDYQTPLPAFRPDLRQETAPRPSPSSAPRPDAGDRLRPEHPPLRTAWDTWRAYVMETEEPLSRRERRLLASVAAEEAADWEGADALRPGSPQENDDVLAGFARKLSREPWRMQAEDLDRLRAAGYAELAVLHVISVVAHQNADSRLIIGLRTASQVELHHGPLLSLPESLGYFTRRDGQPERPPAELSGDAMPQQSSSQQGVLAAAHLDRGHLGDRTGALGISPGLGRISDLVSGPVREQDPAARQLRHRFPCRQPGRQPRDR